MIVYITPEIRIFLEVDYLGNELRFFEIVRQIDFSVFIILIVIDAIPAIYRE